MKPAILMRAAIYIILAMLPELIKFLSTIVEQIYAGVPPTYHWSVWSLTGTNMLYQGVLALRIYIDGSAERSRQQTAPETSPNPSLPKGPNV